MTYRILTITTLFLFAAGSLCAQTLVANANDNPVAVFDGGGAGISIDALPPSPTEQNQVQQNIKDIHFDFDRSDLRPEDRSILESDAQWLRANPKVVVTIEGDADDRGGIVYNVVLSDKRAATTKDALVSMGVPPDQIVYATGWGKLYPVCEQSDETCWSQNRRAHFSAW
jgi:peptidoglycan-associated lipoprotein